MSDGVGFNIISGAFLEKVAGNERLARDLPRKRRDAQRDLGRQNPAQPVPADEPKPETVTPAHIDLRA